MFCQLPETHWLSVVFGVVGILLIVAIKVRQSAVGVTLAAAGRACAHRWDSVADVVVCRSGFDGVQYLPKWVDKLKKFKRVPGPLVAMAVMILASFILYKGAVLHCCRPRKQ